MKQKARVRFVYCAYAVAVALACASCQTMGPPPPDAEIAPPAPPPEFIPMSFLSKLSFAEGKYPDLFSPESSALWVGSDITALRRAEAIEQGGEIDPRLDASLSRIAENYLIIECEAASVFADMSIAYDVVGFRGISVYLLTPDGGKVTPTQMVVGSSATEEQREALKLFRRSNLVIFPKRDQWQGGATIDSDAPAVRLVLEGYDSVFYFEWPGVASQLEPRRSAAQEKARALKTGFKDFYEKVKQLGTMFH